MDLPASTAGKLPRRRNGKDPACEPCRKGKMRCDHTLPHCLNCQRRRLLDKCIYLAAPQTRPGARRSRSSSVLFSPAQPSPAVQERSPNNDGAQEASSPEANEDENTEEGVSLFKPSSGFYGPTAFSAVFLDNEDHIGSNVTSPVTGESQPRDTFNHIHSEEQSSRVALGIKVLSQIPDQETWRYVFDPYANDQTLANDKLFHTPTVIHCVKSLWSTFGSTLQQPGSSGSLEEMAQLLSKNTKSVFRDTGDGDSWLASLSGKKLRWEMLGIMLCTLGSAMLVLNDDDPFLARKGMPRLPSVLQIKKFADGCIQLSNQMDNINFLMVTLLFKNVILESLCTGDTSLLLWRQHGDMVAAATGLGLHRAQNPEAPPTIFSEMRKRTWAVIFAIDKALSAFTGRPPGLSHRYNSCPLPLDLDDDVLLAGEDDLAHAVKQLDVNGWSTKVGNFSPATNIRTTMIYAILMSEILEIALGSDSQYSDERLMDLKRRNEEIPASFPRWLILVKEPGTSNLLQWTRLGLRFRHLHCSLLLEQLSTRRGYANQQHLLDVAREMLELTVYMWTERDRFRQRHPDYDWMIMCYGIPSASMICVELLKQMKQPWNTHFHLPRSEVIQNLSMLVGFLEWVRPTAANRELCGRMRSIIKNILDTILEAPPVSNTAPQIDDGSAMFGMDPMNMDDLTWLDSIDWTRGPFVDLGSDMMDNSMNF